ncbi:hypothetical protein AB0399_12090 [Streptomyces sp. NPDC088194]|uniref:hypothetical protein n=1 Tax=Streptomyces sp. NPDC088194 TaxID=3154931 RepID=UPI00344C1369
MTLPTPCWQTPIRPAPTRDAVVLTDPDTTLPIAPTLRAAGMTVAAATVPALRGDPYREAMAALDRAPLIISAWSHPAVNRATSALVAAHVAERSATPGTGPVWIRLSRNPLTPAPPSTVHIPLDRCGALAPEAHDALLDLAASDLARQVPGAALAARHLLTAFARTRRGTLTPPLAIPTAAEPLF